MELEQETAESQGTQYLKAAAYDIADRYRIQHAMERSEGDWNAKWLEMIAVLRQRCPGFTDKEYGRALEEGFVAGR
jgi:hypothetical protein